jgi:hypothetical protein
VSEYILCAVCKLISDRYLQPFQPCPNQAYGPRTKRKFARSWCSSVSLEGSPCGVFSAYIMARVCGGLVDRRRKRLVGSKCRKCKTEVSECMDLGYLLHLEPTHLDSLHSVRS